LILTPVIDWQMEQRLLKDGPLPSAIDYLLISPLTHLPARPTVEAFIAVFFFVFVLLCLEFPVTCGSWLFLNGKDSDTCGFDDLSAHFAYRRRASKVILSFFRLRRCHHWSNDG